MKCKVNHHSHQPCPRNWNGASGVERCGELRRELAFSGRPANSPPPSGESGKEGGDAEGDASPAPAPQPTAYLDARATALGIARALTSLPPKEEACRQLQLNLQAPPPAVLPKPDHRPKCRRPVNNMVNNYRVVERKARLAGSGLVGGKEHRMLLSVTLCFCTTTTQNKTVSSPSFLYSSPQTVSPSPTHIQ